MTEPTDADRKHAAELIWGTLPKDQVGAVARALAVEREAARIETREWMIDQIEAGATFGRFRDAP